MFTILVSDPFDAWLSRLKDFKARARIVARLRSAALGHFGDTEPVGDGVFEMRLHTGPGYRLYYTRRDTTIYLMLIGGDKGSQRRDVQKAKIMAKTIDGQNT